MESKQIFFYWILSIVGIIIDYTLIHYHVNISYSFMMLFLQVSLYNIKYKKLLEDNKTFQLIVKLVGFIVLPVIVGLTLFK